jgi:hypothetical protein
MCSDSTCQDINDNNNIDILNINHMKILLTNSSLEGNIVVEEINYSS